MPCCCVRLERCLSCSGCAWPGCVVRYSTPQRDRLDKQVCTSAHAAIVHVPCCVCHASCMCGQAAIHLDSLPTEVLDSSVLLHAMHDGSLIASWLFCFQVHVELPGSSALHQAGMLQALLTLFRTLCLCIHATCSMHFMLQQQLEAAARLLIARSSNCSARPGCTDGHELRHCHASLVWEMDEALSRHASG